MTRFRLPLCFVLACFLVVPALAQRAESSFKAGTRAEAKGNFDAAYEAYKQAHDNKPSDSKYLAAYLKSRLYASAQHIQAGQSLRDIYKLNEALAEFRRAAEIDGSNFAAFQEIRRTTDLINKREAQDSQPAQTKAQISNLEKAAGVAAGPVTFRFLSNDTASLHMVTTTDVVYKTICILTRINELIVPDYQPQQITLRLTHVNLRYALSCINLQ